MTHAFHCLVAIALATVLQSASSPVMAQSTPPPSGEASSQNNSATTNSQQRRSSEGPAGTGNIQGNTQSSQTGETGAPDLPAPVVTIPVVPAPNLPGPSVPDPAVEETKDRIETPRVLRQARAPALLWLESQGVSLTALGDEGGLSAYLGEAPGGQMQVFYLTPDGLHIVAGMMFREGGSNVTAAQIAAMRERFDSERRRIQEQQERMSVAERTLGGGLDRAMTPAPERTPSPRTPQGAESLSPERAAERNRVISAAEGTAWFSIGREGSPVVYMLADPQCPHCHSVWAQLRPRVEAGEIMVKVILVAALAGSEEKAISIMARPEPGRAWLNGEGSTNARVAPPPPANSRQAEIARRLLQENLSFARAMGIRGTPWLAYVDRNGELRTVEGATEMSVFLRHIR